MMSRRALLASALGLLLLVDCGATDQKVNPGANQNPSSDGGLDGNGVILQVSYQSLSIPVDLGSLATTDYKGVNLVKLSDVWAGSGITADRSTLEFEFVSTDGFKPSEKGCVDVAGSVLEQGYIDPASRNLRWDESLGFRGCYSVNGTEQMNAHSPTGGADAGESDAAGE